MPTALMIDGLRIQRQWAAVWRTPAAIVLQTSGGCNNSTAAARVWEKQKTLPGASPDA
jgi:hypothetical protein